MGVDITWISAEALENLQLLWSNEQHYTFMAFSAGVHDVICTRKINIDRGGSRGHYYFFLVHITSCTPAEKAINVLLYNHSVL